MTLATKIAAASKAVGGTLKADARNIDQGYNYLSADLILSICGQALAEQGVVIWPSIEATDVQTIARKDDKFRYDAMLRLTMTIADGETEQRCDWIGLGTDYMTPDKAVYKAITSGHKYFIMKLLNVGAGNEDGEHEPGEEGGGKAVARQTVSKPVITSGPIPVCPKCGGPMWDNRESNAPKNAERAKQGKNALPDFKCRDKNCEGVVWPLRENAQPGNGNGHAPSEAPTPEHWIDDPTKRKAFWAKVSDLGLSEAEVHSVLGESVRDFKGTGQQAISMLKDVAAAKAFEAAQVPA